MRFHHEIAIDPARCIGCGRWRVDDCPAANLVVATGRPRRSRSIMCALRGRLPDERGYHQRLRRGSRAPARRRSRRSSPRPPARRLGARRSTRRFADVPVPDEALADIVEAGRLTPTGGNAQDVSFIVLRAPRALRGAGGCACSGASCPSRASWMRRPAARSTTASSSKVRRRRRGGGKRPGERCARRLQHGARGPGARAGRALQRVLRDGGAALARTAPRARPRARPEGGHRARRGASRRELSTHRPEGAPADVRASL